jgi:hypothetical protein
MSERPSTRDLIALARHYVRTGAMATITLDNGVVLPAMPICIMSLTEEMLWFLLAFDDHAHAVHVQAITAGDDGEVLIAGQPDSADIEIFTTWHPDQQAELDAWLESTKVQMVYLPVSPDPPNIVRYEGLPRV